MNKREILIIFVLAVLVTGGSCFYGTAKMICPKSPNIIERFPPCDECIFRGLPLNYYGCWAISGVGYSEPALEPVFLVVNFLFWFFVAFGVWQGVKYIKRKFANK